VKQTVDNSEGGILALIALLESSGVKMLIFVSLVRKEREKWGTESMDKA
jgi:hypothetical protein